MAVTISAMPCTIWKTPLGIPASTNSSVMRIIVMGTFSEGFKMTQLPIVSAIGIVHIGTIARYINKTEIISTGKLHNYAIIETWKIKWNNCCNNS